MTKKYWAYLLLAFGLAMIYSVSQLTAGKTDASTTMGKLQNDLAEFAILGSPTVAGATSTPFFAYGLLAAGAWLLFGRKLTA